MKDLRRSEEKLMLTAAKIRGKNDPLFIETLPLSLQRMLREEKP